jgi:hypothetical protein
MHDFAALESPRCTSQAFAFQSNDCGSQTWAYLIFITWNILSMYFMLNLFVGKLAFVRHSHDCSETFFDNSGSRRLLRLRVPIFWKSCTISIANA